MPFGVRGILHTGELQVLLVALDHSLDHLAADGAGLAGSEVAVVALLQVDANLPWCSPNLLNGTFGLFFVAKTTNSGFFEVNINPRSLRGNLVLGRLPFHR